VKNTIGEIFRLVGHQPIEKANISNSSYGASILASWNYVIAYRNHLQNPQGMQGPQKECFGEKRFYWGHIQKPHSFNRAVYAMEGCVHALASTGV